MTAGRGLGDGPPVTFQLRVGRFLQVSFQRYPRPPDDRPPPASPRSWGALPVARLSAHKAVVPLPEGEALWLGLGPTRASVVVAVRVAVVAETLVDALTGEPWSEGLSDDPANYLEVPPAGSLDLLRRSGAAVPITRDPDRGFRALRLTAIPARRPVPHPDGERELVPLHMPGVSRPSPASLLGKEVHGPWRIKHAACVYVRPVDLSIFKELTGQPAPPPLDPANTYRGWRLP